MHQILHFSNIFTGSVRFWTTSFIIIHVLLTLFEPFMLTFHSFFPISLGEQCTSVDYNKWIMMEQRPSSEAVTHLVKKFPAFHGTRSLITVFTSARHWYLSSPHARFILILSSSPPLGLTWSLITIFRCLVRSKESVQLRGQHFVTLSNFIHNVEPISHECLTTFELSGFSESRINSMTLKIGTKPLGTRGSFPGDEAAGSWSWPLTPISYRGQECVELYLHSPSTPLWRGVQLKAQGQLYLYLIIIIIIYYYYYYYYYVFRPLLFILRQVYWRINKKFHKFP
jgi:hypothetical protein